MPEITPAAHHKLSTLRRDFLIMPPEEQRAFILSLRARRIKPPVLIKAPKTPKPPKPQKQLKELSDAQRKASRKARSPSTKNLSQLTKLFGSEEALRKALEGAAVEPSEEREGTQSMGNEKSESSSES